MTIFYALEQTLLLKILDELVNKDAAGSKHGPVLDEKLAAAGGSEPPFGEEEWLFGGRRLTDELREGGHFHVWDRGAVFPEQQLQTSAYGKACPVYPRVLDGSAHSAAMDAVNELELHC